MLCVNCAKEFFKSLSDQELMVLCYIYGRESRVRKVLEAGAAEDNGGVVSQLINIKNTAKIIAEATRMNVNSVRFALKLFVRMGALMCHKNDHAWNYSVDELGRLFIQLLSEDKPRLAMINRRLKEGLNRA